jgi:hypothetical protein
MRAIRGSHPGLPSASASIDASRPIEQFEVTAGPDARVADAAARIPLIDHHTHSIVPGRVAAAEFELMLTESDRPAAAAATRLESQVGVAVRRWCAPLLGLSPSAPADAYVEARVSMSNEAVAERLLPHAGFEHMIVETGHRGDDLLPNEMLAALAGAKVDVVVRLETVAERVLAAPETGPDFPDAFRAALYAAAQASVGWKSIVAYRHGLDFDPERPSDAEVARAASIVRSTRGQGRLRLTDPVLLRFLLWEAVDSGRPLQIHTGYGDPDLNLARADPLLLSDFIRAVEGRSGPLLLLHTYPFQRHAGYLAQMFPHVFIDVGLAVNFTGVQSSQVIAESLELAPFSKVLFSSDAWGLPELHLLGSWLFRRGMSRVLGSWVAQGDWSVDDALAVLHAVARGNALRIYGS